MSAGRFSRQRHDLRERILLSARVCVALEDDSRARNDGAPAKKREASWLQTFACSAQYDLFDRLEVFFNAIDLKSTLVTIILCGLPPLDPP